jgi:hypothetical protein
MVDAPTLSQASAAEPPPHPLPAEPGPAGKLLRLVRTVLAGTFAPRAFLARWEAEPGRWSSPLELLSVNGLLVGGFVYAFHLLGLPLVNDPRVPDVVGSSRAAGVLVDLTNSAIPVAAVWGQVLAIRLGAALSGAGGGWARPVRLAGFLAAYYVPATLLSVIVGAAVGFTSAAFLGITAATLAVELAYSWLGFRRLYGHSAVRSAVGAVAGFLLAFIFQQAVMATGMISAVIVAKRFPN